MASSLSFHSAPSCLRLQCPKFTITLFGIYSGKVQLKSIPVTGRLGVNTVSGIMRTSSSKPESTTDPSMQPRSQPERRTTTPKVCIYQYLYISDAVTNVSNVARTVAGSIPGTKEKFILHILGGKGIPKCPYASDAAIAEATKQRAADKAAKNAAPAPGPSKHSRSASTAEGSGSTAPKKLKSGKLVAYTGHDMPFSVSQASALQSQTLRAIISTNSAFRLFEDPEMLALFGMMGSCAPDILPSRKVVSECILNEAASIVEEKLVRVLKNQVFGLSCGFLFLCCISGCY